MPDPSAPARPGRPRSDHGRPRYDIVRRGGCRLGKDLRSRRPGARPRDGRGSRAAEHRRHHLHREGGCRATRPHPKRAREDVLPPIPKAKTPHAAGSLWTSSTGPRSAPSTRSPNACSPNIRSKPDLPPRVEVLDEVSSKVAFERRWRMFRDELLADPALERTILLLLASGVKADALRSAGRSLRRQLGPRRGEGSSGSRPSHLQLYRCFPRLWPPSVRSALNLAGRQTTSSGSDSTRSPLAWTSWRRSRTSSTCSRPSASCPPSRCRASASATSASRLRTTAISESSGPV